MFDCFESFQLYFRNRLAALRMQIDKSAQDMSLSMGQSKSYINNIENGQYLPTMKNFYCICEHLHVTPKEFFDDGAVNPGRLKDVINDLRGLSDKQLAAVAAMIKEIRK